MDADHAAAQIPADEVLRSMGIDRAQHAVELECAVIAARESHRYVLSRRCHGHFAVATIVVIGN